jgi:hypothetical protein
MVEFNSVIVYDLGNMKKTQFKSTQKLRNQMKLSTSKI